MMMKYFLWRLICSEAWFMQKHVFPVETFFFIPFIRTRTNVGRAHAWLHMCAQKRSSHSVAVTMWTMKKWSNITWWKNNWHHVLWSEMDVASTHALEWLRWRNPILLHCLRTIVRKLVVAFCVLLHLCFVSTNEFMTICTVPLHLTICIEIVKIALYHLHWHCATTTSLKTFTG